jgi:hypothetical protein
MRTDLRHDPPSTARSEPATGSTPDHARDEEKSRISSSGFVSLPPAEVFAFLVDVRNHSQLASRGIEVLELDRARGRQDRGLLVIRGPLGIRRRVRTTVLEASEDSALRGVARVGRHTVVDVSWELYQHECDGTRVVLSAYVRSHGFTDGLLLALGGRAWMRRLFAETIERLSGRLAIAARRPIST